jgi:hypothetical protein
MMNSGKGLKALGERINGKMEKMGKEGGQATSSGPSLSVSPLCFFSL